MKVLIIEDEPYAQQELKRLLDSLDEPVEILEMIDSVEDAVEWLQSHPAPGLIFLDIQLADGLSFEIFRQVEVHSPVIFTTAYDQYAIEAFRLNSIDYLLKPIRVEDLRKATGKLQRMREHFAPAPHKGQGLSPEQIEDVIHRLSREYKSRFVSRIGDQIRHIPVEDIAYFYAEDNVVFLITRKNERVIVEYSIEEISRMVDPKHFFRLNRAFVAHIQAIGKVYKYLNSRLKIELLPVCEKDVLVSRVRVGEFMGWMDR
ncbi:MAG: LytTR family DNA-binding domain-containing protein [Bacteroidetes bacterium]|nr:LytTR family DNA-binding domain-containing protein [Bacteroidota bacterium]